MGIGKWNAESITDTNADGTVRKIRAHVVETITEAQHAALVLRASEPYTQANFDDYAEGILGSWYEDLPQAVRVFFRTSYGA